MCVVLMVPLATYDRALPATSTTPKPVVRSPGSMPRMRIRFKKKSYQRILHKR